MRGSQLKHAILPVVLHDEGYRGGTAPQAFFHDDPAFEDIAWNRLGRVALALIVRAGQFVFDLVEVVDELVG